ncbi:MAG: CPBP family intramembrane metalloprotease [Elusimicrobia bacterium]|nr:CPBP family intramembrane metalloprotease [Elusimicrobiota bacterium]
MLGTGFYGLNLPSIGWRVPDSVKKILAAVAVALFYKFVREAVFAFYYKSTPCFSIIPGELWSKLHNPLSYYFLFIIPFAIPIFEELFYRGFVYKVLEEKTGWKGAVIVSACLFSIFHTEKLISINFEIFLKGLIFGLLRKWDGSIWSSVAAHSTGNLLLSWFSFRA